MPAVTVDDIVAARRNFTADVRRTPLLSSRILSEVAGGRVLLKAENLQHTGSFKVRGAFNRLAALSDEERQRGVVAASAGNHAQGIAVAARAARTSATIVMPRATPLAKVEATRAYGANVTLCGDSYDEAYGEAESLAGDKGRTLVSAFNDPLIVAGQGTVGLEIAEDAPEVDAVVVPVGGGGLISGIAVALKSVKPSIRIIGVQAQAAPGVAQSLSDGQCALVAPAPTIADGIAVGGPGDVTFPLLQRYVDDVVLVDEDEIAQAMVLLIERSKLIVEGAGAAGVAALMSRKIATGGVDTVVVLSGGNVDINLLARVVEHGLTTEGRYFSLSVGVDDKPGKLAAVSAILADAGANVLSVSHQRFGIGLPVGRVQIVLLLEVRDRAHAADVEAQLASRGFIRGPEGGPTFVPATWA